jgi:Na+-transporting methylmalonyl-CoA/oxaloacetate decarboxylase gamma subunit
MAVKSKFTFPKLTIPKGMTRRQSVVMAVVFVIMPLLLIFSIYLNTGTTMTVVPPEQASEAKQDTKTEEDVPTIDQAIDAAIRAHERSTKVCYDEKIEGFLIHYPYLKPDEDGTKYFNGWYYLKWSQMWKTDNGIWFMKDFPTRRLPARLSRRHWPELQKHLTSCSYGIILAVS